MSRANSRWLSRLEKLAEPVIAERKRMEAAIAESLRWAARMHAARLAVIILYGDPKIDEPLALAWGRALERLELAGTALERPELADAKLERALADADKYILSVSLLRHIVKTQPDRSVDAKLARVLATAPQWLLTFCEAYTDAEVLGFDLPKPSQPPLELGADAVSDMEAWPLLPTGTLGAGGPIREDEPSPFRALSDEERMDYHLLTEKGPENWSRQERRRHREILAKLLASNEPTLYFEWADAVRWASRRSR